MLDVRDDPEHDNKPEFISFKFQVPKQSLVLPQIPTSQIQNGEILWVTHHPPSQPYNVLRVRVVVHGSDRIPKYPKVPV